MDLSNYREHYDQAELNEPLPEDPMQLFKDWLSEAIMDGRLKEPNAMSLGTATSEGIPSVRIVLFKEVRERGLVFYTNYNSAKGREISANPKVAATVWWPEMERQVRFTGKASKISPDDSTEYFHSRPRGSQLGAIVSPQSDEIPNKRSLERKLNKADRSFKGVEKLDRPEHWGGYYIEASKLEFWQGRPNRLHDRIEYLLDSDGNWSRRRLAP